jgi:hypothetical protein
MSLSKLTWKYIRYPVPLASSSIEDYVTCIFDAFNKNSYQDGTPRVTGSGVAWSFYRTSSIPNGSNSIIFGSPATMSVMSQSVIIVGSSSAPPFPGPRTVPNYTYDSTAINIAIQKHANLLQYGSWLSGSIFNSGSSGINSVNSSGFTSLVAFPSSTIKSFHILESQEALCIITEYNNQFGYTLAGAFIDPETSLVGLNAEIDGNIYAISTTPLVGQYTIPNWLAGFTPSSLIHSGSNNKTSPKFVYYMPGTDSRFVASYNYSSVVSTNKMCIFYHTTYNNSDVFTPLYCTDLNQKIDLGRFREIFYLSLNAYGVSSVKNQSINLGTLFAPQYAQDSTVNISSIGDSLFFKG